jgi:hypothetical protein
MNALTPEQREIVARLQSGRLMICEGQGDPNSDGCGGQGYTGASGQEPCRHCLGAGVMTLELQAALKRPSQDLVPKLQAVMETLDDLDLLQSSEIVRAARDEISRMSATNESAAPPPFAQQGPSSPPLTAERVDWTCAARRQGTAGGNDPADCDWPVCGCDPYADKVIASLQEAGHLVPASLPGGTGSAEEGTGPGFDDWCFDMDAAPKNGRPVLLTVPSSYKGRAPHVGEAFHHPEVQDGSWWWAGTSHLDHPGISINEGNEAPIAWRYLPKPAALATLHASQDQAGEVR